MWVQLDLTFKFNGCFLASFYNINGQITDKTFDIFTEITTYDKLEETL